MRIELWSGCLESIRGDTLFPAGSPTHAPLAMTAMSITAVIDVGGVRADIETISDRRELVIAIKRRVKLKVSFADMKPIGS